jgi:hypothetical protein
VLEVANFMTKQGHAVKRQATHRQGQGQVQQRVAAKYKQGPKNYAAEQQVTPILLWAVHAQVQHQAMHIAA